MRSWRRGGATALLVRALFFPLFFLLNVASLPFLCVCVFLSLCAKTYRERRQGKERAEKKEIMPGG